MRRRDIHTTYEESGQAKANCKKEEWERGRGRERERERRKKKG